MARKLKFREHTDVVSVRLPVSLIDRLDSLCQALRLGRAEFFVEILQRYPEVPTPKKARVWIANLSFAVLGGTAVLLAALSHAPAGRAPWHSGSYGPGGAPRMEAATEGGADAVVPVLPPRDIRDGATWKRGSLQHLIPRRPGESRADTGLRSRSWRPWAD